MAAAADAAFGSVVAAAAVAAVAAGGQLGLIERNEYWNEVGGDG
jgi:hypothetical protein